MHIVHQFISWHHEHQMLCKKIDGPMLDPAAIDPDAARPGEAGKESPSGVHHRAARARAVAVRIAGADPAVGVDGISRRDAARPDIVGALVRSPDQSRAIHAEPGRRGRRPDADIAIRVDAEASRRSRDVEDREARVREPAVLAPELVDATCRGDALEANGAWRADDVQL